MEDYNKAFQEYLAKEGVSKLIPNQKNENIDEESLWGQYNDNRNPQNSVQQIVDFLKSNPFSSESELQRGAFDYDRSTDRESNKKYADMLRRGMEKGIIARTEAKVKGNQSKYFYFVPASTGGEKDFVYKPTNEHL